MHSRIPSPSAGHTSAAVPAQSPSDSVAAKKPDSGAYEENASYSSPQKPTEAKPPSSSYDKTDFRLKVKTSSYAVSGLYARLAGAGSKSQVQSAMGEARRSIGMLRMTAGLGTADERQKARASIGSLQKLLQRGSRKIRRLNEEALTDLKRKRAHKKEQQEQALKLRLELNRQKAARQTADRAIALEGHLTDANNAYLHRYEEEKPSPASYIPGSTPALSAAPVSPAVPSPAPEGVVDGGPALEGGAAIDVSV